MKVLFFNGQAAGNSGGTATIVNPHTILGNTLLRNGDQIKLEYLVEITAANWAVLFNLGGFGPVDISAALAAGDNLVEIILTQNAPGGNGVSLIIRVSTASGSALLYSIPSGLTSWQVDQLLSLSLQDTSGSPADNTVISKQAKGVYLPII